MFLEHIAGIIFKIRWCSSTKMNFLGLHILICHLQKLIIFKKYALTLQMTVLFLVFFEYSCCFWSHFWNWHHRACFHLQLCISQTHCQCAAMTPSCQVPLLRCSPVTASAPTPPRGLNDQVRSPTFIWKALKKICLKKKVQSILNFKLRNKVMKLSIVVVDKIQSF